MTELATPRHYMVRAMDQDPEQYATFFDGGVVAVGWSRVAFAGSGDVERLVQAVTETYLGQTDPRVAGRKKNEVRRFLGMTPGDRVLVPVSRGVRLAEVTGGATHVPEAQDVDLANQRPVSYVRDTEGDLLTVPRDRLSEGLQRRLRVRGSSVLDLAEFRAEIDRLFEGGHLGADDLDAEAERAAAFKADVLARIRGGSTLLAAGGAGLEHLVAALLEADGYTAEVLSKRAFEGLADADVKASRTDHVGATDLLVQVKHHAGETGAWGAEQLAAIGSDDTWADYRLVLVTSADASDALADACEAHDVTLLDGDALAEWVLDAAADLPDALRRQLRISDVPTLL